MLAHQATLKDLVYENESEVKHRIISELQNLGAADFEQFCMSFLGPLGYDSSKLLVQAQTGVSMALAYSDKASSLFALLFRRSAGGKILSVVRRSISFAARSKATMTMGCS